MTSQLANQRLRRASLLCLLFLAGGVAAAPLPKKDVPQDLADWIPWALHDAGDLACPFFYNDAAARRCSWPSRLRIVAGSRGATFIQEVAVFRTLWIPLPGDAKHWPLDVRVGGKPMPVVTSGERPGVRLTAGRHGISGAFAWSEMPESLPLPPSVGLVSLTVNGTEAPSPLLDDAGRLWLKQPSSAEGGGERLEARISRLVSDDIPMILTTHIELVASGKSQEIVLNDVLLPGFVPLSLDSPLPARFEADGTLRVQVRPGRFTIETSGRHMAPVESLALPVERDSFSVGEEVWAFAAHSELRLVTVEGVPAIDPQQSTLPDEWKSFPAFLVRPGEAMRFNETKRGDPEPAPDQLTLNRNLWLDFDGRGFTVQDHIAGTVSRSWRLEMPGPARLGRVAIDGADQYITRLASDSPAGVELRRGQADIRADSRIDGPLRTLSATGWECDFNRLSARLHLPPGWRLVHAAGVDRAPDSWWERWTLLDLFLVLVIAVAVSRLFGWPWGCVAFFALLLSYHENGAPTWSWLNLLLAVALLRVLPEGRARHAVGIYRWLAVLVVVVILIPFGVNQIRQTIFPALEQPWRTVGGQQFGRAMGGFVEIGAAKSEVATAPGEVAQDAPSGDVYDALRSRKDYPISARLDQIDPTAKVQTGPGLPAWQWSEFALSWSGPVEHTQRVRLWLVSPAVGAILVVARLLLLLLLLARMVKPFVAGLRSLGAVATALLLAVVSMATGVAAPAAHASEIPSPDLLRELREKLLAPPECLPHCAAISRLRISCSPAALQLRLEAHVDADSAIPLPGGAQQWLPRQVTVDGVAASGLLRGADGVLWLQLAAGVHQVTLEGSVAGRDTVQLPLPLRPRHVEAELRGFSLDGLGIDGEPGESLLLMRVASERTHASEEPALSLPPFVAVERTLHLGLTWQIETRVRRAGRSNAPVLVAVPLLAGETVTHSEVVVERGAALVNLGPQTAEFVFGSALKEAAQLILETPVASHQIEVWRLNLGPQWHATLSGIPVVSHLDESGTWLPEWRPWPGEKVTLDLLKPSGTEGQTLTLDSSLLSIAPGIRATDSALTLRLRSSRGGQHVLKLPSGAILQRVEIDSETQPIRLEGDKIEIPVHPGAEVVSVVWREPRGMGTRFETPAVDVGTPGVNSSLEVHLSEGRWLLFLAGPRLGPGVLIWGALLVLGLAAFGLGRVRLTPLSSLQWFLLALGLTQASIPLGVILVGWFFFTGLRKRFSAGFVQSALFHLGQLTLVVWTVAALISLFFAVERGLLGHPDMQVAGNGSSNLLLRWYQDRTQSILPTAWVISIPLFVYRVLMLAWALWLAYSLLGWLRWAWECFSDGGYWRKVRFRARSQSTEDVPAPPAEPSS